MTETEYDRRLADLDHQHAAGQISEDEMKLRRRALKMEYGTQIFLVMNEDGDLDVGITQDDAFTRLSENCGGFAARIVRCVVHMAPPEPEAGPDIVIPPAAGHVTQIEVDAR